MCIRDSIRTALEGGDIPAANAMLGMPYAIRFEVQHGAGLGHTLGVPTIKQLYPEGFQLPRSGIYITRTHSGGVWYPSATGLGSRPTVNDDAANGRLRQLVNDGAQKLGAKVYLPELKFCGDNGACQTHLLCAGVRCGQQQLFGQNARNAVLKAGGKMCIRDRHRDHRGRDRIPEALQG